jgi:hypothetical protein
LVNPGNPPHRHQTRSKADSTRSYHRMVTLHRAHQAVAQHAHFKAKTQL